MIVLNDNLNKIEVINRKKITNITFNRFKKRLGSIISPSLIYVINNWYMFYFDKSIDSSLILFLRYKVYPINPIATITVEANAM